MLKLTANSLYFILDLVTNHKYATAKNVTNIASRPAKMRIASTNRELVYLI